MTHLATTHTTEAAVDDAGATAFSISDANPYRSNAEHRRQLLRWDLRVGGGAQITSFESGLDDDPTGFGPSATDDGQKVVFLFDLQLTRINADGTGLVQLTSTPASIGHFQIAGNGSRVVFESTSDLTGENIDGLVQVFAVEAGGSNLPQVTAHISDLLGFAWPTISDDGMRIAYLRPQGASDGLWQIAGVLQNGTGFHWLTSFPNLQLGYVQISGNGQSVAFQCYGPLPVVAGGCEGGSQIAIVDWDATGL